MAGRVSKLLTQQEKTWGVEPMLDDYEQTYKGGKVSGVAIERDAYRSLADTYYALVTDFYEFGWGKSFHFAPRVPGETFKQSLARHEHFLALNLNLKPGMLVGDFGCGIGGPLIEIARFSGAKVVGVNSNGYQIEKAKALTEQAGLSHLAEFLENDYLNVDAADSTFDAIYAIESTCHAPDKVSVYSEAFRLLKPGGMFGVYEYCVSDKFDPMNERHRRAKKNIEYGGGLFSIDDCPTVEAAMRQAGFELLEARDLSDTTGPSIAWYQPLAGEGVSLASFRSTRFGRTVTVNTLRVLEALRLVPRGSVDVANKLNICASGMIEAGTLGIFTPMYFLLGRKPA